MSRGMGWDGDRQLRIDSEEESNGWIVGFLWRVFYREKWFLDGLEELVRAAADGWLVLVRNSGLIVGECMGCLFGVIRALLPQTLHTLQYSWLCP